MEAFDCVIYLCKCALNKETPDHEIVSTLDLDVVYREATRHMLSSMVGMSLQSAGISTPAFRQAIAKAQRKTIVLNNERRIVFDALDAAGIWHMALKGSVLKDWYPKFGMRESADCDVLFDRDREEDVRDIMVGLGYEVKSYGKGHHDVYLKKPISNFEMHTELFGLTHGDQITDYYRNIEQRLVNKAKYEFEFSPSDFYLYFLAHEYEHYSNGGTGFRSVVDTWIILNKLTAELRWDYIKEELAKIGITEFEKRNRSLATHLFGGSGELIEQDKQMLAYIMKAGTYGTFENSVVNGIGKHGGGIIGRIRYFIHRAIIPMDIVKGYYPTFYKYKILLPLLPFYRAYVGVRNGKINKTVKAVFKCQFAL